MKRLFWVTLGATAGVLVARRLRQTAAQLAPGTLAGNLIAAAQDFLEEVRGFAAEREVELRDAFGLDEPTGG
jgi:hypothetical protein